MRKKESPTWQGEAKGNTSRQNDNTADTTRCQSAAAQRQRILERLKFSAVTTLEAREKLDIMHPAARCMELRKRGHNIITSWTTEYSAGGTKHRIARYSLEGDGGND